MGLVVLYICKIQIDSDGDISTFTLVLLCNWGGGWNGEEGWRVAGGQMYLLIGYDTFWVIVALGFTLILTFVPEKLGKVWIKKKYFMKFFMFYGYCRV